MEMIAPDGGRCFGFSVNSDGRAMCEWRGAFCECRTPNAREATALKQFIREKQAELDAWGLSKSDADDLDAARKRLIQVTSL